MLTRLSNFLYRRPRLLLALLFFELLLLHLLLLTLHLALLLFGFLFLALDLGDDFLGEVDGRDRAGAGQPARPGCGSCPCRRRP